MRYHLKWRSAFGQTGGHRARKKKGGGLDIPGDMVKNVIWLSDTDCVISIINAFGFISIVCQ